MSKAAGDAQIEDVFKEPVKQKEALREEIKCEDFSLILAQWKAQSGRKLFHATVAAAAGAKMSHLVRDNALPTSEETAQSTVVPTSAAPAVPETGHSVVAGADAKGKAALFWSTLKGRPAAPTMVRSGM